VQRITPREVPSLPKVLASRQQQILVGTLLGDGCLAQHGRFHRLFVKHQVAQRALAEFKKEAFDAFVTMPLHEFDQRLGDRRYPCVQFVTRTAPVFSEWHSRFYSGRRKCVPLRIAELLTPLAMAVWFMDDGGADYAGLDIQAHGFESDESELLVVALAERFGIRATTRANKGRRTIYIPSSQVGSLRSAIEPHILPELRYKLVPRRERTP
jgi:LAGLIDADG DNA endonuclease family